MAPSSPHSGHHTNGMPTNIVRTRDMAAITVTIKSSSRGLCRRVPEPHPQRFDCPADQPLPSPTSISKPLADADSFAGGNSRSPSLTPGPGYQQDDSRPELETADRVS